MMRGLVVAMLMATVGAIYPDGHFDHVKQLTEDNFESVIEKEINAGKTMFVRWIASPN